MKKVITIGLILAIMAAAPARAADEDLLRRIDDLEERVSLLEILVGVDLPGENTQAEADQPDQSDQVVLAVGTWIVGEDFPAGKYTVTCTDGSGMLYFYNSYEDRKENEYSYSETYYMGSSAFVESVVKTYENLGSDGLEAIKSMYTTEINNVRLEDGNCIYSEASELTLTPIN